jgi:hypothetical protein
MLGGALPVMRPADQPLQPAQARPGDAQILDVMFVVPPASRASSGNGRKRPVDEKRRQRRLHRPVARVDRHGVHSGAGKLPQGGGDIGRRADLPVLDPGVLRQQPTDLRQAAAPVGTAQRDC